MEAVLREVEQRRDELGRAHADTIYIGGGTPSQLSPAMLQRFFEKIDALCGLSSLQECTVEANPDDVTPEWVRALKDTPVNRVSMGVQSLDDGVLRFLGRRHTAKQALDALDLLRTAGFENISLDLMFGLPGQNISQWEGNVKAMLEVSAPHLSAYALQLEEGTVLAKRLAQDRTLRLPSDDEVAEMYDLLVIGKACLMSGSDPEHIPSTVPSAGVGTSVRSKPIAMLPRRRLRKRFLRRTSATMRRS